MTIPRLDSSRMQRGWRKKLTFEDWGYPQQGCLCCPDGWLKSRFTCDKCGWQGAEMIYECFVQVWFR